MIKDKSFRMLELQRITWRLLFLTVILIPDWSAAQVAAQATAQAKAPPTETATATSAQMKTSTAEVDQVLSAYRKAKSIRAKVKKTVKQEFSGINNESEGMFYFSKGKLRMDFDKPEKSSLVYDGKWIWVESQLDPDTIQVTKMKSAELKKSDSLLAALFERKDVLSTFKLIKRRSEGKQTVYEFSPKDKKKTEVQFLELSVGQGEMHKIAYRDQLENEVRFEFSDLARDGVAKEKFRYRVPKGATVTEI